MKVTLIMATTADGFIARNSDQLVDWTAIEDKAFFRDKTEEIGTVVMGLNTYRTLPGPLPGRLNIVMSTTPAIAEAIPSELEFFSGEPRQLLDTLSKRGIEHIALVGGGQLNGSFLVENLVDEVYITVAPLLFGQGLNLSSGHDLETRLQLLETQRLGGDSVLLQYEVMK